MNKLFNGMVKIWQGLPDKSKEAFINNLSIPQQNLLKVSTQLMQNYIEAANYQESNEGHLGDQHQHRQENQNYQANGKVNQAKNKNQDDDDIIDVEWTEKK
jgi:hypothetical protein